MKSNAQHVSPEFPSDELLIFIGYSDDASAEAITIYKLQSEIEKDFRLLLKSNGHRSPFSRIRLWKWNPDALAIPGGQEAVVTPALNRAQIALFIFRDRVGTVTWQELEQVRKRSKEQRVHILAFFPDENPHQGRFPDFQAKRQAADNWAALLKCQEELTTYWTNPDACSVTPCPTYQNSDELKVVVLEKLKDAMADILAGDFPIAVPTSSEQVDVVSALALYRSTLKEELGYIRMLGLPGVESIKVNLNDDTFVPLRLSNRPESGFHPNKKDKSEGSEKVDGILNPDEVMQRAFKNRRMLLVIGDPGAGKTTLLKYYALCALDDDHYKRLGFADPINVFYLPLRDVVRHEKGHYDTLPANFAHWSETHHQPISASSFKEWLQRGMVLVLLDGLDEISNTEDRREVCSWIDTACSCFSNARFVVTSRATGYRKDEGVEFSSNYERADVQDFTAQQQERFLRNWFNAAFLGESCEKGVDRVDWERRQRAEAEKRTLTLLAHLNAEKNKGLRQLAAIPMILQIMAILWKERDYMPESRLELYKAALDYMLEFKDRRRGIKPLLSATRARQVLGPVSLWMQVILKKEEVGKAEMHCFMQELLDTLDEAPSAEEFCHYLVNRAGLLAEYGVNDYVFRHKSFREYLAGVQFAQKMNRTTGYLNDLVIDFGDDWWFEPIRFFFAQADAEIFDLFMEKLFESPVSDSFTDKQQSFLQIIIEEAGGKKVIALCKKLLDPAATASRQRVVLDCLKTIGKTAALDALQQFILEGLAKNRDVASRAEEVLLALGGQPYVVQATTSAGEKNTSYRNPNEENAEYILIPGGNYRYSVTDETVDVPDLYVAKYPVTNRLYRSFIAWLAAKESPELRSVFQAELETIGMSDAWGKEFADDLKEGKEDLAGHFRSGYDEDRKYDGEDQPVVGITWYAARAYCLWLSLLERERGCYRLPNEQEWEWVAGGQRDKPDSVLKVRDYPWPEEKGEPGSTLANYNKNIGATTPVGRYPEGATPEGLYDMAGNVDEWMENWYNKEYPSIRGGCWYDAADALRCSSRGGGDPGSGGIDDVGFRVIRSSHFSLPENLIL